MRRFLVVLLILVAALFGVLFGTVDNDNSTAGLLSIRVAYAAAPDITNALGTYDFGSMAPGATSNTGLSYFQITNAGTDAVTVTVAATDYTGGVTWTMSDTGAPAANTVGLYAGIPAIDMSHLYVKSSTAAGYYAVGSLGAAPTYGDMYVTRGAGTYTVVVKKTAPYNTLVTSIAIGGTQRWGMQLYAPTSFTDTAAKTNTVTLTATVIP